MKRLLYLAISTTLLAACSPEAPKQEAQTNATTKAEEPAKATNFVEFKDATEFVNEFKKAGIPITRSIIYTEDTDENTLLGRPNQYFAKVNWSDERVPEIKNDFGEEKFIAGTVELFNNEEDLKARKDYVESVGKAMPSIVMYQFAHKNALLRLHSKLTPTQAKAYQEALDTL